MIRNIKIRPAKISERQSLEDLQRRASLGNEADREALLANPDAIEISGECFASGHVFVSELHNSVVGFAVVIHRSDRDFDLDGLFVDPDWWLGGVGRMLVEYCAEFSRAHGAARLHVVGNPHAEGFYLRNQFDSVGVVSTRFGPGLLMCRNL